tara:strand:+ start:885 stop:1706 length:822 start_codon:yes stop_codon:yes gene_type:complete
MQKTKYAIINKQIADILAIARQHIDVTKIDLGWYGERTSNLPVLLTKHFACFDKEPLQQNNVNKQFWDTFDKQLVVKVNRNQRGARGGRDRYGRPFISLGTRYLTPYGGWNYRDPQTGIPTQSAIDTVKYARGKHLNKNSNDYKWALIANKTMQGWYCDNEYASISKDPEIGSYFSKNSDYRIPLAIVLCHEIAHAIDYAIHRWGNNHQKPWQDIYRILRNHYVNNLACIQDEPKEKPKPTNIIRFTPKKTKSKITAVQLDLFKSTYKQSEVA